MKQPTSTNLPNYIPINYVVQRRGTYEQVLTAVLTLSDPGYFRQLTIRGGGFKSPPPPPYDLENYWFNLPHIIHVNFTRCFWHDPIGIFQKFAILTILQRFRKVAKIAVKIIFLLFCLKSTYTKRRGILMRI